MIKIEKISSKRVHYNDCYIKGNPTMANKLEIYCASPELVTDVCLIIFRMIEDIEKAKRDELMKAGRCFKCGRRINPFDISYGAKVCTWGCG